MVTLPPPITTQKKNPADRQIKDNRDEHPLSLNQAPHRIPEARTHSQLVHTSRTDEVEIRNHGQVIASGRIDLLAMDGSVLWLQQDDGQGKAMFLHSDGLRVYRRPVQS
jgi:hypothetical protein